MIGRRPEITDTAITWYTMNTSEMHQMISEQQACIIRVGDWRVVSMSIPITDYVAKATEMFGFG